MIVSLANGDKTKTSISPGASITGGCSTSDGYIEGEGGSLCSFKSSEFKKTMTGEAVSIDYNKSCTRITISPGDNRIDCDITFLMPSDDITMTCNWFCGIY